MCDDSSVGYASLRSTLESASGRRERIVVAGVAAAAAGAAAAARKPA